MVLTCAAILMLPCLQQFFTCSGAALLHMAGTHIGMWSTPRYLALYIFSAWVCKECFWLGQLAAVASLSVSVPQRRAGYSCLPQEPLRNQGSQVCLLDRLCGGRLTTGMASWRPHCRVSDTCTLCLSRAYNKKYNITANSLERSQSSRSYRSCRNSECSAMHLLNR